MFEIKSNQEIGAYLKEVILSKYPSCRQFCVAYVDLTLKIDDDPNDMRSDEIRKLTNRLSQILKGVKAIQTYDLPVFSELLGISCEEMLTAGAVRKPILFRRTNYNIAFSHDVNDWKDYLAREDCIAAYADEFGKTVVDYALEFKNYKFLRFLMENGYIQFVSNETIWDFGYNFGAKSLIKDKHRQTLENQFLQDNSLRTRLIALALESDDESILEELHAREFPVQYTVMPYRCDAIKFANFYDEKYIDAIVKANDKVFDYFCQEYYVTSLQAKDYRCKWLFPFFGAMIEKAIKLNPERALLLSDIAIAHNREIYDSLRKEVFRVAKKQKQFRSDVGFTEIIKDVLRDFHINEERNYVTYYAYWCKGNSVSGLVILVNAKSKEKEIQDKIDQVNELYNMIINIQDNMIKQ